MTVQSILLARDFSPVSNQAFRHALDLASRTGATLHVLYADVLHNDPFAPGETPSPAADVDRIRKQLQQHGNGDPVGDDYADVEIKDAVVRDVAAAPAILSYASQHGVDLITLGTHGRRGIRRVLLGSVAEEVVRRADRPVLTVRGSDAQGVVNVPQIQRILAPVDFSEPSRRALKKAQEWAAFYDAEIDVLHVVQETLHPAFYVGGVSDIHDIDPNIEEKVTARLQEFIDETGGDAPMTPHVRIGEVDEQIPGFVEEEGSDLVVTSTHGRTGLKRIYMGSVAEKIVRLVPCPVLTVKAFAGVPVEE